MPISDSAEKEELAFCREHKWNLVLMSWSLSGGERERPSTHLCSHPLGLPAGTRWRMRIWWANHLYLIFIHDNFGITWFFKIGPSLFVLKFSILQKKDKDKLTLKTSQYMLLSPHSFTRLSQHYLLEWREVSRFPDILLNAENKSKNKWFLTEDDNSLVMKTSPNTYNMMH